MKMKNAIRKEALYSLKAYKRNFYKHDLIRKAFITDAKYLIAKLGYTEREANNIALAWTIKNI